VGPFTCCHTTAAGADAMVRRLSPNTTGTGRPGFDHDRAKFTPRGHVARGVEGRLGHHGIWFAAAKTPHSKKPAPLGLAGQRRIAFRFMSFTVADSRVRAQRGPENMSGAQGAAADRIGCPVDFEKPINPCHSASKSLHECRKWIKILVGNLSINCSLQMQNRTKNFAGRACSAHQRTAGCAMFQCSKTCQGVKSTARLSGAAVRWFSRPFLFSQSCP